MLTPLKNLKASPKNRGSSWRTFSVRGIAHPVFTSWFLAVLNHRAPSCPENDRRIFRYRECIHTTQQMYTTYFVAPRELRKMTLRISYKRESDQAHEPIIDDMWRLFQSEEDTDFELSFPDGILKAHSLILKTRSNYFAALVSSGMQEAQTKRVDIADCTVAEYRPLLEYIYCGTIRWAESQIGQPSFGHLLQRRFLRNRLKSTEFVCL